MDVEEEIRSLRLFRHDLEGRGIMSIPDRVAELEKAKHNRDIDSVRLEATIQTLTVGFDKVQRAIEGFHTDIKATRDAFTAEISQIRKYIFAALLALILSNLVPQELLSSLVASMLKIF